MAIKKWFMKQYWRIGTIRALTSLALGMFVLGRLYYADIPYLADLKLLGALLLGSLLFLLFLGIGWIYDVKIKMWKEQEKALYERHPYQYVPNYSNQAKELPWLYASIMSLNGIAKKLGLEEHRLDDLTVYLGQFYRFQARRKGDIRRSPTAASEFMERAPFIRQTQDVETNRNYRTRAKIAFQVQILRLGWIQSLTGLFQDVLVLGALYITLLFPAVVVEGIVPYDYLLFGLFFISMPIYILLTILGWYYDKKLKMWSPEATVNIERNPFSYIPEPRVSRIYLPFFYAYLTTLSAIMDRLRVDKSELVRVSQYIESHISFAASQDEDMITARRLRREFGDVFEEQNKEV